MKRFPFLGSNSDCDLCSALTFASQPYWADPMILPGVDINKPFARKGGPALRAYSELGRHAAEGRDIGMRC